MWSEALLCNDIFKLKFLLSIDIYVYMYIDIYTYIYMYLMCIFPKDCVELK